MKLVTTDIADRAFLLQFFTILQEFGDIIPWLSKVTPITFSTNPVFFRDQLLQRLGCNDEGGIVPYQLVAEDEQREYLGGVLHFPQAPEAFKDFANQELLERLQFENYRFITCLQVRGVHRRVGHGRNIMQQAIASILHVHAKCGEWFQNHICCRGTWEWVLDS